MIPRGFRFRTGNIRTVVATDKAQLLLGEVNDRRMFLIQNEDANNSVNVSFGQGDPAAFVIPPTGQYSQDMGVSNELWVSTASGQKAKVQVLEIVGYDNYELEQLSMLDDIRMALFKLAGFNFKKVDE